MGSGDGWTLCAAGHRHWGRFGAAGVLISDGDRVILQHRAPWTHEGGRWGIPGGARDAGESAVEAALREAAEEAGLLPKHIVPFGIYVSDHGGWTYSTVLASPDQPLYPTAHNAESVSVEWIARSDVTTLPLHDGFAAAWPKLERQLRPFIAFVGDAVADDPAIEELRSGIPAERLTGRLDTGELDELIFRIRPVSGEADAQAQISRLPASARHLTLLSPADLDRLG